MSLLQVKICKISNEFIFKNVYSHKENQINIVVTVRVSFHYRLLAKYTQITILLLKYN